MEKPRDPNEPAETVPFDTWPVRSGPTWEVDEDGDLLWFVSPGLLRKLALRSAQQDAPESHGV